MSSGYGNKRGYVYKKRGNEERFEKAILREGKFQERQNNPCENNFFVWRQGVKNSIIGSEVFMKRNFLAIFLLVCLFAVSLRTVSVRAETATENGGNTESGMTEQIPQSVVLGPEWVSRSLFVQFKATSSNEANITEFEKNGITGVFENVSYWRDGKSVPISWIWILGQDLVVHPNFLDKEKESERNYVKGDLLCVSSGLVMWKWVGTVDSENNPEEGYYVRDGQTEKDYTWYYNGSQWKSYVAIEQMNVSAKKELFVGEKTNVSVTFSPENGTLVGEKTKFYTKDPTVASIDENGTVYALSAGTVEIVAVAEDLFAGRFSESVSVVVREKQADVLKAEVVSFAFRVNMGEEPDLSGLSVLLTDADGGKEIKTAIDPVLTGFDKNKVGVQKCVLSYSVDGVNYESEIEITVNGGESGGCASSVGGLSVWAAAFPLFAVRVSLRRKKEDEK